MYFYRILGTSLRADFIGINRKKICIRRFNKSTCNTCQKGTNDEEQLPSYYDSNTDQSLSSPSLERPRKRPPFPILLPSDEKKLNIIRLNEDILSAENLNGLLDIYLQNKGSFDNIQYLLVTKRLSELFKNGDISDLPENIVFQSFCYDVWKITTQLEAGFVLKFYNNFLDVGVSSSYLLMQALLQMMRHQINIFNLKDLLFLHPLMEETEPCNLKYALQLAIPRAVENCINIYIPPNLKDYEYLELLKICISGEVKGLDQVLEHFYDHLLPKLLLEKGTDMFDFHITSLLNNLLELLGKERVCPLSEESVTLARILAVNCVNALSENDLYNVDKEVILNILNKLGQVFNSGNNDFVGFLSNVAQKCLSEKWDINSFCQVIDSQLKLQFMSDELISFVASNLTESATVLSEELHVLPLISALAASDFPSQENDKIVHSLMNGFTVPTENIEVSWLKFALNLLSLNYFPENLLKSILNEDYLRSYLRRRSDAQEYVTLLKLHRTLKALQWDAGLKIPEQLLRSSCEAHLGLRQTPSLRSVVEKVVGNKRCLISNVITPRKNDLDHLIILDAESRPIPFDFGDGIGFESIELHDISKFEAIRKVALVEVPDEWTYKPGLKLKGEFKLELQLLEKEGFEVLKLYEREIEPLQPEEVLVYLREKLRNIGIVV